MQKGKLIVIDGIDGSGKKTQVSLLAEKMQRVGRSVKTIDFPQYENNLFGKFIGECLTGEHGDFVKLDAKIASVLYAADRFESSEKIRKWLEEGYAVIVDRYVNSNQIHQGGKIKDKKKREEFLKWLDKMEFEIFKIPRPDVIVYLNVPPEISRQLLQNKNANGKKKYLKGKKDVYENDYNHLLSARQSALDLVKSENNWLNIECVRGGKMMSPEEISKNIWRKLQQKFNWRH